MVEDECLKNFRDPGMDEVSSAFLQQKNFCFLSEKDFFEMTVEKRKKSTVFTIFVHQSQNTMNEGFKKDQIGVDLSLS